ncbi:MAG: valine--tRNA ligase [Candidatus Zambryskibacteria bacterium]|nr:valine--tRNA ligase [Candidatus Zambryskibacteria bacterium]
MNEEFKKPYNPALYEEKIYKLWEESGFFNPDVCIKKNLTSENSDYFSIVLPPPNVTGTLHTGHAFMLAIEDILIRYNRMLGKKTLWVPGTDHAAIATESIVVKQLSKEKTNKRELGREKFLERVNTFAKESHDTIINQLKKMGASLDWSREAFTLDKKRQEAVFAAFKQMYEDGLIYRGFRIVNWDPKSQTTVSDDEVDHEPRKAKLYYFKYDKNFPITIATTRPETKLGDTAVAVNPNDNRYKQYIGQTFSVDFVGVPLSIKVIGDKIVNPEFGTGALGVTPSHSQTDWELADKHGLEKIQVIDEYARITTEHPDFHGKKTSEAREIIVEKLKASGLFEKEEEIDQNISISQRTGAVIEPLPKLQWFIDVNKNFKIKSSVLKGFPAGIETSLKKLMSGVVEDGQIEIIPSQFKKIYAEWLANLHDWCISRQIWYGHRIPVWYKGEEARVNLESPGEGFEQDSDTLDTWFSSGLWTFSTLGWPNKTLDFKNYHPISILETGHDILFFWVARMILMSTYLLGDIPFKKVYLHGIVLDKNGKKMSKSNPETAVDPLEIINKHGADALRMAMIVGVGPGSNNILGEEKIKAYKHFGNKIWNIARFVLENNPDFKCNREIALKHSQTKKYIKEFDNFVKNITGDMENFRFHLAAEKLYHYTWHTFADIIVEESKTELKSENKNTENFRNMLGFLLKEQLKLLHPFMPFITEKIWLELPNTNNLLLIEKWPDCASRSS